jgi:hypothetical protein
MRTRSASSQAAPRDIGDSTEQQEDDGRDRKRPVELRPEAHRESDNDHQQQDKYCEHIREFPTARPAAQCDRTRRCKASLGSIPAEKARANRHSVLRATQSARGHVRSHRRLACGRRSFPSRLLSPRLTRTCATWSRRAAQRTSKRIAPPKCCASLRH